ncbi:monooxygenase flavin-binding family protein-like protein [Bisporella sp. PMI_857]|nr:monooxygenase flavin-binding family protein-like protein [Bisporella sp. PMI_857]
MGSVPTPQTNFDVIIIGAGISGINAAYRVQTELPTYSYTILENRNVVGGTWDLFRYPGIRSDSDMYTFGFPWCPWKSDKVIADGESIRNYIKESAEEFGIDERILFHHKLLGADWNSKVERWYLKVNANGQETGFSARFVIFSTGYYDYNEPLKADIPGIDNFKGKVIHPQFWPEDFDYTGKKVVIIGSGATAVTLLPALAEKASHVTMLQRSPTYVIGEPALDSTARFLQKYFPVWLSSALLRFKFIFVPLMFFKFCRRFPNAAKKFIKSNIKSLLPKHIPHDPHFTPRYNPWEQRLCLCPDHDFFIALQKGNTNIVTDVIQEVQSNRIVTKDGMELEADIIVKATGLKIQILGGAPLSVDGQKVDISSKFFWRSVMLQDVPNAAVVIGYTNASWTLGADTTATMICRLIKYMDKKGYTSMAPQVPKNTTMKPTKLLDFRSTYLEKATGTMPWAGTQAPWKPRNDYFSDRWNASYGTLRNLITDLEFKKQKKA